MNSMLIIILLLQVTYITSQSTCPVVMNSLNELGHQQQRCKCGIKTDGQIYIYCARKQLKRLPKFTRSSILYEELILSGNQIEKINVNSFSGLRVKRLFLDDNPLNQIEPNSLTELANYLEELVITVSLTNENEKQLIRPAVPLSIFQNLLNLKIVKLAGMEFGGASSSSISSELSYLKQSTFNRTRKLEVIHLVDCGLQRIEQNSFAGVEFSLKELNLDNNQLTSTLDIFSEIKRMKRLQTLILSRNKIRKLNRFTITTSNNNENINDIDLNEFLLDLSFNAINQIDEYSFGIYTLGLQPQRILSTLITKLNLNNNELNQFQLSFINQLVNLKELYLDYNKIETLPENLFTNSRYLETLSLKGNSISAIQSEFSFSGLHFNLKRLNLASNKMQSLGKRVFMQTSKLRELNLERNNLGSHFDQLTTGNTTANDLMNTFEGIESELRILNLENNQLRPVHLWALSSLLNIETLKLGHNKMNTLDLKATNHLVEQRHHNQKLFKVFEFYRNLTNLDMQNSSLNQMPYFESLNQSLITFNLANNQLCNINANNLRKYYNKLKYLNLNSNPLKCDCNLISLKVWLDLIINSDQSNDPSYNWKCVSPNLIRNKYFNQLNTNYDFNCDLNNNEDKCLIDQDDLMFKKSTTTSTTTTPTTSTTSTTTTTKTISTTILPILIFETTSSSSTKFIAIQEEIIEKTNNNETIKQQQLNKIDSSIELQNSPAASAGTFFSSNELKQTLLGSFIGALSVILIVFIIIGLFKVTHKRYNKRKNISICNTSSSNDSDKDKTRTTNTTSSCSPYDLTKLSLCINNCGGGNVNNNNSSACSSSGTSSCTSSSLGVTNSSCICGILKSAGLDMNNHNNELNKECLFNKMDPLRLTMLSSASANNNNNNNNNLASGLTNNFQNRSSFYQHYLNCSTQPTNQLYNCNNNNIHYIASHLPYSSPAESLISGSCPSPYGNDEQTCENKQQSSNKMFTFLSSKNYSNSNIIPNGNNNISVLNGTVESNTYDKLHQRLNNSSSFLKPSNNSFNTLSYSSNSNNQFLHNLNGFNILNAETTPFLILQSANGDLNRIIDLNAINENSTFNNNSALLINNNNYDLGNNQPNFIKINHAPIINNDSYQHTYHEIGDVLINMNNNKNVRPTIKEEKSEMFI